MTRNFCARAPQLCRQRACRCTALSPGDALLRGPLYAGLPTLEAHRTAAPSAAFADLALNYGLDGIFAGDPEVSAREQEYIRHFCTTGELCLPVALRPGYETLYDRTFTCRPDSPKGLVRYQESRLYSCFGSTVQPDNCVERRRRCVTMDNIGYGRYSGEIQLVRADLPADEKVNVIGEVPAEYDLLLDCIKRGKTFRMVKSSKNKHRSVRRRSGACFCLFIDSFLDTQRRRGGTLPRDTPP